MAAEGMDWRTMEAEVEGRGGIGGERVEGNGGGGGGLVEGEGNWGRRGEARRSGL